MEKFEDFVKWLNEKLDRIASNILVGIAAVVLPIMVLVITIYVILRKFTEVRIYFVEEWTAFLIVLLVYFALGYTFRTKGHVTVDMVVRHLSETKRLVLELISGIVGMILISYFLQRSLSYVIYNLQSSVTSAGSTHTPMWIPSLFVPLGLTAFGLGLLGYSLQKSIEVMKHLRKRATTLRP
ncbi:TRAP transporter small permease [Chloroflexota bacterium]